uniref:Uncharacterized protein n=1 Tax=Arundo donax TaxID=35708 RepID=A0A0A9CSW3_ARUDO
MILSKKMLITGCITFNYAASFSSIFLFWASWTLYSANLFLYLPLIYDNYHCRGFPYSSPLKKEFIFINYLHNTLSL